MMNPHTFYELAEMLESIVLNCGCGARKIHLTQLDMDDAISYLKYEEPIYHMGMLGCCEKLRCINCDDMPSVCECGNYEAEEEWQEVDE